jgi:hypothetical protein
VRRALDMQSRGGVYWASDLQNGGGGGARGCATGWALVPWTPPDRLGCGGGGEAGTSILVLGVVAVAGGTGLLAGACVVPSPDAVRCGLRTLDNRLVES